MGSGAQSKLADASAADLAGAYGELPNEAKIKLQEAMQLLQDLTKMLDEEDFVGSMQSFLTKEVPLEALVELQWYLKHPDLQKDQLEKVSRCATVLQSVVSTACTLTLIKKQQEAS